MVSGNGAPASELGNDSDLYIDADNGLVYQKDAGAWSVVSALVTQTFMNVDWYAFGNGVASATIVENGPDAIEADLDGATNGNAGIGFLLARFGNVSLDPDASIDFAATVPAGQEFRVELVSSWGLSGCNYAFTGTGASQNYFFRLPIWLAILVLRRGRRPIRFG